MQFAEAVEQGAEHPLGRAVVAEAKKQKLELPKILEFKAQTGYGVKAVCAGHMASEHLTVFVGNLALMRVENIFIEVPET